MWASDVLYMTVGTEFPLAWPMTASASTSLYEPTPQYRPYFPTAANSTRPTAHDRMGSVRAPRTSAAEARPITPGAHSAEGSRRDRTSPLSLHRRERRRLVSPEDPAALGRGPHSRSEILCCREIP